ncbi:BQ5605_C010g05918 [Microbotryum silenes-dioicae]|uniref:BQ5605_C010g05918 protein n=1 Tax=Microbotryum silenes-dioicae TaxID=796604 RepID=A0A2X0LTD3_9BASI|nr:BQ5605_C010g05918 [Microbotryum silenes-dioicae]
MARLVETTPPSPRTGPLILPSSNHAYQNVVQRLRHDLYDSTGFDGTAGGKDAVGPSLG